MKKAWRAFANFWKGIWEIVKSMGNWRGVLSLLIVWLIISGSGIFVLGFVFNNTLLKGIGIAMYAFWLGPFTPLIPLNIALAMVVQRFVFLDKNVSWKSIKEKFRETFKEDKEIIKKEEFIKGENDMLILAVETSCDETSVSITRNGKEVLSNIVLSQIKIHQEFGGVVPEVASRNHVLNITRVFDKAIKEANVKIDDIDLVAVTKGPGLIGALLVGINAATAFAFAHDKPLVGVNHLAGHIYAANIENELKFPLIALVVSGGHTSLVYMDDHMSFKTLGETLDDAVGEAYDKVSRMMGEGYPGGPILDKLAKEGKDIYNLPRAYLDKNDYKFSFSGLKSAVNNLIYHSNRKGKTINNNDLAASFQEAVIDVLIHKLKTVIEEYPVKQIVIAGGVAANSRLRERVYEEIKDIEIIMPSLKYCTDNAAMIGIAAYYTYKKEGSLENYQLGGYSTLNLDE
jgi:N6-L-threonylcarbamoyladenine synthase